MESLINIKICITDLLTRFLSIVLIFILLISCNIQGRSQTLHALIFTGNNDISEILREGINKSKEDMRTELKTIASSLHINYEEVIGSDALFNAQYLMDEISRLNPGSDDIVFFYYVGHGINKPEIDPIWPQLAFATSYNDISSKLISFSDITAQLEQKRPRLLIAMAEACNSTSGRTEYYQDEILGLGSLSFNQRDLERLKDLYLRSEGTVVSSSSEPGQKSYVSAEGGYFSNSFIEVEKELTSISSEADWQTLFEKTKYRTTTLAGMSQKNPRIQVPQFKVNVKGIKLPDFDWQHQINNQQQVFKNQPQHFNYQTNYQNPVQFLVAKVVFFGNKQKVYFVMPDNYITEYNPLYGLQVAGYRTAPAQPQFFQWDIISYYSPFQFNRWGVDYYGRIMEWNIRFGWQFVGIVYY